MSTLVYYNGALIDPDERTALAAHLRASDSRLDTQPGDLVIGRYSVLPGYRELERDIARLGGRLIHSYREHRFVADLMSWYPSLADVTFPTWFALADIRDEPGPFVLKGATNSKKFAWTTHMFARDFKEATAVYGRLTQDGLIGDQPIYIRRYVALTPVAPFVDLNGLPVTEEYRVFCLDGAVLAAGFYWANHIEDDADAPAVPADALAFVSRDVLPLIRDAVRFVVVDVARTQAGAWIVVELSDGQMSGLSCIAPDALYSALAAALS